MIKEIGISELSEYAKASNLFESDSILEIQLVENGLGGIQLKEKQVEHSHIIMMTMKALHHTLKSLISAIGESFSQRLIRFLLVV